MPVNDKLRDLVSHRVTFEYENGASISGYVAACRPAQGEVLLMTLTRVQITDGGGNIVEQHREMTVVPQVLVGYRLTEGPSAAAR